MERKIGETFEFEGKKLQVKEIAYNNCDGCFFDGKCFSIEKVGDCGGDSRYDRKSIIFVEVKDEQPQEQAEQSLELNLCEVLKYCPQGEMFWSPLFGDVKFNDINKERGFINIILENGETWNVNADGTISFGTTTSPEIMLYPSREQRDWTKFTAPWLKKEKFDPKTLKPFDRVIIRNVLNVWTCTLFSHISDKPDSRYIYVTCESVHKYCIPYNDETKHLVGTTEEAPEFYRYWEN